MRPPPDVGDCLAAFALGVFLMMTLAAALMSWEDATWEKSTVKHGAAEYNQTTGAWQWKEAKEGQ